MFEIYTFTYHGIIRKSVPPPKWIAGGGKGGGGTSRGEGYVLVVGCGVGLCWNVGEACRRWSHMCGSWYLPKFLFRGDPACG